MRDPDPQMRQIWWLLLTARVVLVFAICVLMFVIVDRADAKQRCWRGIVPVRVARIRGPWHTVWVKETICGNTVTL